MSTPAAAAVPAQEIVVRECFVCAETVPTKVRRFAVLYYWLIEPICRRCWEIPTDEPKDGPTEW